MKQIVEDKSQLILTILALMVSMLSIGLYVELRSSLDRERRLQEQLVDAKMQAAIAKAEAAASDAKTYAKLSLDRVDKTMARLEARGLIKLENH